MYDYYGTETTNQHIYHSIDGPEQNNKEPWMLHGTHTQSRERGENIIKETNAI